MGSLTMGTHVVRRDSEDRSRPLSRLVRKALVGCAAMLCVVGHNAAAPAEVELLHTYGNSIGQDVVSVVAISMSKLLPLLPAGYNLVPASGLGFGGPDQGIVVIANFRGIDPTVDRREPLNENQVAVDVAILVFEPSEAVQAGVNIPGAFHLYALTIYTNDARYAASLRSADIPVEFVNKIGYRRDMNDATGVGDLTVSVPSKDSPFHTFSSGQGYVPVPGAFNVVFWHNGQRHDGDRHDGERHDSQRHDDQKGKAVLHFLNQPFRQGTAISHIYTQPNSTWDALFNGGGLGSCDSHPQTGYRCVIAPALNLRYDEGSKGELLLIR